MDDLGGGQTLTARRLFEVSAPVSPDLHLVRSQVGLHLLLPNGNRLFDVDAATFESLDAVRQSGNRIAVEELLRARGLDLHKLIDDQPIVDPQVRALSLAVAQKCNLGCTYCYAQQGTFGGPAKNMPLHTALLAVDLLFRDVSSGERVNLSFLGGEPLVNRSVIRTATERARQVASAKGAESLSR